MGKHNNQLYPYFFFVSILIIFTAITTLVAKIPVANGVSFANFQISAIFIPGLACTLLLRIHDISDVECIAISYALGYFLNIVIYLICVPIGIKEYMIYVVLAVFLGSITTIIKWNNRILKFQRDSGGLIICLLFTGALCGVEFFTYMGRNILPRAANETVLYNDVLYWVGNTVELTFGFPPKDFIAPAIDKVYHYHYLSSLQLAMVKIITQIDTMTLSFCYSYIQPLIIIVFSLFCLLKRYLKKTHYALAGLLITLCTIGYENRSCVSWFSHMYIAPFGFDIGLGIGIFTLFLFLLLIEQKEYSFGINLLVLVSFSVCVWIKGPIGAILLVGIGFICFQWLLQKNYKRAFFNGVAFLACFAMMWLWVLSESQPISVGVTTNQDSIIYMPSVKGIYTQIMQFGEVGQARILKECIFIIYYVMTLNPIIIFLFGLSTLVFFIHWREIEPLDGACFLVTVTGIVFTRLTGHAGTSQIYFAMMTYPFAVIFGLRGLQKILGDMKASSAKFKNLILFIVLGGLFCLGFAKWVNMVIEVGKVGYENIRISDNILATEEDRSYINQDEYQAYLWIRENTAEQDICMSNKILKYQGWPGYINVVGGFAERHVYMVGWEAVIEQCMNNDREALEKLKEAGVKYMIISTSISPQFELPDESGEKVFENEAVLIYKIG